jgi:ribosomal protein S9
MTEEPAGETLARPGERYHYGTGRRKTAVARVRLYPGSGTVIVNQTLSSRSTSMSATPP